LNELIRAAIDRFRFSRRLRSQILGISGLTPRKDRAVEVATGARLVEEALEVRDAVRRGDREKVLEELGDLLIEVEAFMTAHEINLEDVRRFQSRKQRELGQLEG
jgi:NTP pyrophosphatase (non-canonical NTP hydrolase)